MMPKKNTTERRLMRLKAAADYLGLSPWRVRKLIQDGLLPAVVMNEGAPWLVDRVDLDRLIELHKRTF
jgi:excisionase family DNA binding protein